MRDKKYDGQPARQPGKGETGYPMTQLRKMAISQMDEQAGKHQQAAKTEQKDWQRFAGQNRNTLLPTNVAFADQQTTK